MEPDFKNSEVLRAFREGDRDVLAALYKAHRAAVEQLLRIGFGFSSRGTRVRFRGFSEPFEFQEMVQDGFLHAFRESARQKYDPKQPYRPYLITIVRNLVIDRYRRKRLERSLFVDVGPGDGETVEETVDRLAVGSSLAQAPLTPELQAMHNQLSVLLQTFVATLDDADKRIITDHLMGDLSQAAMADALEIDRNDLRKRIRAIREQLLRHLKREGFVSTLDPAELFQMLLVLLSR